VGGRSGPYAPWSLLQPTISDWNKIVTEMKAVRSMETSGMISTSCSDATSSSSGGVTDVRRE
jgi:hypothetical protein